MTRPRPVAEAENRLVRFNGERDAILSLVTRRVTDNYLRRRRAQLATPRSSTCSTTWPTGRFSATSVDRSPAGRRQVARWRDLAGRLGRLNEVEKRAELERLVGHYASDIVGNFNPRVYRFANDILPPALSFLFTPVSSLREGLAALDSMSRRIQVEGEIDAVRTACDRGHAGRHADPLVQHGLGRASASRSSWPSCRRSPTARARTCSPTRSSATSCTTWAPTGSIAGSGSASTRTCSRSTRPCCSSSGYHSLFFPGGTRCRSNAIESHLKLGLLGTGAGRVPQQRAGRRPATAASTSCRRRSTTASCSRPRRSSRTTWPRPASPATSSRTTSSRRIGRILEFVRKILVHEGAVIIRFGRPLDPFGNTSTTTASRSIATAAASIRPPTWSGADGEVTVDPQREAVYTRELGAALAAAFRRETVFHVHPPGLPRALFDAVVDAHAACSDIYRLLRLPPGAWRSRGRRCAAGSTSCASGIAAAPECGRVEDRAAGHAGARAARRRAARADHLPHATRCWSRPASASTSAP